MSLSGADPVACVSSGVTGLIIRLAGSAAVVAALLAGCSDIAGPPVSSEPAPTPDDPVITPVPPPRPPAAAPVTRSFPRRLPDGRPPQFVVVSFDGAGDLGLWGHWRALARSVDARMTFFLSGPFVYPEARRTDYKPAGKRAGASDVGFGDPAKVLPRAAILRQAIGEGHEIGSHANGHFCGARGINRWTSAQWETEFQAFDRMVRLGPSLAAGRRVTPPFDPATVRGIRTPCLEGKRAAYRPVMRKHGMRYDASDPGKIAWPVKTGGLWSFPLQSVPLAGTKRSTLTMDYNLWFSQNKAKVTPPGQVPRLKRQALATYRGALAQARAKGNAPLFLGNHFNRWNRSVYADALTIFVRETCRRPGVKCVSNIELVAWLEKYGVPRQSTR